MTETLKISVKYFALFREQANTSEEIVETTALSPRDLYLELSKKYGFTLDASRVKVSINEEFKDMDARIHSNDSIVFVPPVAGG